MESTARSCCTSPVLVVLEPVGVVLEDPELCGRLLLHVFRGAMHRLVGPRVVGRSGLLKVVAPLAALAGHARGQVLLQRLDSPVHHGRGVAVLRALRSVHGFRGQLPVQRGELIAKPSLRSPFMSLVKLVLQTTLPVLPAITRQPGFLCVERLFVCTSASSLIMMSSHWCAPPSHSRKTRALWLPSSRSSRPLSGAALLLDTCSLLQPAQFFVRKRSSEKSEVLVTVSVLEAKSCGAETVPELVTSPQTTLPVDTPPLVAVKVQSRLSQSSGPVEAAPVMVSVAPVTAWWLRSSPRLLPPWKLPALAVLFMVRVLPVILVVGAHDVPGEGAQGHGVALQLEATVKLAEATELWLLERTRKLPSVVSVGSSSTSPRVAVVGPSVEELVLQQQRRGRSVLLRLHCVAGLQGCVQDLEAVDVHRSCRLVGQARRLEVRASQLRSEAL